MPAFTSSPRNICFFTQTRKSRLIDEILVKKKTPGIKFWGSGNCRWYQPQYSTDIYFINPAEWRAMLSSKVFVRRSKLWEIMSLSFLFNALTILSPGRRKCIVTDYRNIWRISSVKSRFWSYQQLAVYVVTRCSYWDFIINVIQTVETVEHRRKCFEVFTYISFL